MPKKILTCFSRWNHHGKNQDWPFWQLFRKNVVLKTISPKTLCNFHFLFNCFLSFWTLPERYNYFQLLSYLLNGYHVKRFSTIFCRANWVTLYNAKKFPRNPLFVLLLLAFKTFVSVSVFWITGYLFSSRNPGNIYLSLLNQLLENALF